MGDKKENDEKTKLFDFIGRTMLLFKNTNIKIKTFLFKILKENKKLIVSFFIEENREPKDQRLIDFMNYLNNK